MGLKVAVATRLQREDFPRLEELRQAGVQVYATPAEQTSGIANYYQSSDMERRICKLIGFAGTMTAAEIPDLPARVIMVAGIIAGEVDLPLLIALAKRAPLALDVQGFVRVPEGDDLVFKPWPEMAEGLRHVTYLKVDRAEAEHLTGESDLRAAAVKLAAYGPQRDPAHPVIRADRLCRGEFLPGALHAALPGGPHRTRRHLFFGLYCAPPERRSRKKRRAGRPRSPPSSRKNPARGRDRWQRPKR